MDTPNLWFLQNCKMHDFCKCGMQDKLGGHREDLYSNGFMKVRFSFSRHCNRYLLWSLTVSYEAGQPLARNHHQQPHRGMYTPSGYLIRHWDWNLQFLVMKTASQWRGKEPCDSISNQKGKSNGAWCICLQWPWLVSPPNVYTVAFVYLLSFLQDRCSGIVLFQCRLYACL